MRKYLPHADQDGRLNAKGREFLEHYMAAHPRPLRLFRTVAPQLYHIARNAGMTDDDITGELMLAAARSALNFDPDGDLQFSTYLGTSLRRCIGVAVMRIKAMKRTPPCGLLSLDLAARGYKKELHHYVAGDAGESFAAREDRQDTIRTVRLAISKARLTPRQRMVLRGYYGFEVAARSQREIARELGVTQTRVYQLLHAAESKVAEQVAGSDL